MDLEEWHDTFPDLNCFITEEVYEFNLHHGNSSTDLSIPLKRLKFEMEPLPMNSADPFQLESRPSLANNEILHQAIRVIEEKKERERERRKNTTNSPRKNIVFRSLPVTLPFRPTLPPFRIPKKDGLPPTNCQYITSPGYRQMESFPPEQVPDWKHAIYNFLVENHNSADKNTLVIPCIIEESGHVRHGFILNPELDPKRRIAELYALHVRKAPLNIQKEASAFAEDIYRYYLRAAFQLMSKYFQKLGAWSYLYEDIPLFVPNETLDEAEERIRLLETKQRKRKRKIPSP